MKLPLVFLPGMMCDFRIFSPQIEYFSGERVICVAPVAGFESIEGIASKALEGLPEKFVLVGLSLGGILAMEMVRLAPDRIAKVAFLDTNHKAEISRISEKRLEQIKKVQKGELLTVMANEMKPNYLAKVTKNQVIFNLCKEMAKSLGPNVFIEQSRALTTRSDQTETLKKIKVPTLVLCGEEDRLCPIQVHKEIASLIKGAKLEIVPNAGHLPTLENSNFTNLVMKNWLS